MTYSEACKGLQLRAVVKPEWGYLPFKEYKINRYNKKLRIAQLYFLFSSLLKILFKDEMQLAHIMFEFLRHYANMSLCLWLSEISFVLL